MEIKGLNIFRGHFKNYQDQYVLIGGTAAVLRMNQAGLDFRSTKDFDIILHIESLTTEFIREFWEFIKSGEYEITQYSNGAPCVYRFLGPKKSDYPEQIELFSRRPDCIDLTDAPTFTPIPAGEDVSSLSAILLEDVYYHYVMRHAQKIDDLSWIAEDCLIPLKAHAWLNMQKRVNSGDKIDSHKIRKHLNDVIRLSNLLSPETLFSIPNELKEDLQQFLQKLRGENMQNPRDFNLSPSDKISDVVSRIAVAFGIDEPSVQSVEE